ncbi:hypothetical protein [Mameliella sediminis]|uniref:hypothetical protein n=1 Tax=Mameliella sediminis TaxID=2836866 RepID=UPI001C45BC4F|nr:hypothetical protein [Mameliella sediminis]MBV7393281.1 hypothetical protein [Mameliella sediminis]
MTSLMPTRRHSLFVLLGFACAPGAALARIGNENRSSVRLRYSQVEFGTLERDALMDMWGKRRRWKFQVTGFGAAMTQWLIYMALSDRLRLKRLMADMRKLTKREDREARLLQETKDIEKEIARINAQAEKLAKELGDRAPDSLQLTEMGARMAELGEFLRGVKTWLSVADEGQKKPEKVQP